MVRICMLIGTNAILEVIPGLYRDIQTSGSSCISVVQIFRMKVNKGSMVAVK
jgi:hypothetical protein